MPFVTKLTFQSGDQQALDRVVNDIKQTAAKKGVELKGPRAEAPTDLRVPQYKRLDGQEFPSWRYTVYTRRIDIVGHDDFARQVANRELPPSIHVGAEVERVKQPGYRN
ncbi:uS10/mL48 family ribosomal protein [Natronomonas sp. EA1]|uniref:uS10/mL48 family ribosomal protein n=1 Tax=Natronomonas sp. EA1 TaxID=3421655 RepID=UPI003EC013E0